jgi:NADPH2 dehydrogenase
MGPPYPAPHALDVDEIAELVDRFAAATRRAARIGFDLLEIHAAHGYLFHQFLSSQSNLRTDAYGGTAAKRCRFLLEAFTAIRAAWPEERPLGVRLSAVDWATVGITLDETVEVAQELKSLGCDYIVVTSGGLASDRQIPIGPGYQVQFAAAIREAVGIPTMAVGMITDPHQAEEIIARGKSDLVALARGMLYSPRWAWHAADALGVTDVPYPVQYERARPAGRLRDAGNWTVADLDRARTADGR